MCKNRKGFTLIELLIVITIIGILAVAFLPTLLGAPAKGRDTQRIADLQKLQKVLVNADLEGTTAYPAGFTCLDATAFGDSGAFKNYLPGLGGNVPASPSALAAITPGGGTNSCTNYAYLSPVGAYKFGLYTRVENEENANTECSGLKDAPGVLVPVEDTTDDGDYCYAILTQ